METSKCNKCKHEWVSRIDNPKQCPRCKNYNWNKLPKETSDEVLLKDIKEEVGKDGRIR